MYRKIYKTKSSSWHRRRFTSRTFFFVAMMLALTTALLGHGINVNAQSAAPQALRSDIQIRNVMNTLSASPSIRIAKDPRDNTLYYLKLNGEIYAVNLAASTSTLLYSSNEHTLTAPQGMAIGPNGTIYLVGNTDIVNAQTRATIVKGVVDSATGQRVWSILAQSADYPKSNTAFDHRFNGVSVSPSGDFIYVNSGSRTDHGEVQSANGLYPNTREVGLTACIFRLPTNGQNLFLANDRATLKAAGYIFAEGTRNTFDMAFAPNGDLLGTENGPDRDMSEELNWLRQDFHYGFPWRMSGVDNPQQFPDYNPANDLLLDRDYYAVQNGYYYNDPTFPTRPSSNLTEPIINSGPDADSFRDLQDGLVKDASDIGQPLSTFTAHRSPLGLVFDTEGAMSPEFQGDGFVLGWNKGDPTGVAVSSSPGSFNDPSEDLLHLDLTKIGDTNYGVRTTRIVGGFSRPVDAEIIGNKIYVLEYGGSQGIWEVTMPHVQVDTTFEENPTLFGWTTTGAGASWTTAEYYSDTHSILAQTDTWSSSQLDTTPLQWYRLSFKTKAPGTINNPGSIGYGYWSASFYDKSGNRLSDDQYSSIFQSNNWVTNEFRIRAKTIAGPDGTLLPTKMIISFHPLGSQPFYVDDVTVQTTTTQEVAQWADSLYNSIPAKLNYIPKANRWQHIPLTMQKLKNGQNLRIVMLGDSIQNDTLNSPIDVFLERQYPGSQVELISSVKGATGVQYYKDRVQEFILNYKPDLLMIGGISNSDDMNAFQSVIDQVRASDTATGHTTEIMLLTKAWSPNSYPNPGDYFLNPSIRELDQNPVNNTTIPDDYRGHLLQLANLNGVEYLDMTGITNEFIYGPAAIANFGPPDPNGNPYSYWMRDYIHLNDYGKQILGRELAAYFAPDGES